MASEGGKFNYKEGKFTIALNSVIGDENLSAGAIGLYMKIAKDISNPNVELTRAYLEEHSKEGKKAFDTLWKELKEAGYLKTFSMPGKSGDFVTEHELLDEPVPGASTFWLDKEGNITRTNLDMKSDKSLRLPQKGGVAKVEVAKVGVPNGGDNINNNTIYNTDSSIYDVHDEVAYVVQDDILKKMDDRYKKEFPNMKAAINSLANRKSSIKIAGEEVSAKMVIDKLDELGSKEELVTILNLTLESYVDYTSKNVVKAPRILLQSIFWEKLTNKDIYLQEGKPDAGSWEKVIKAVKRFGRNRAKEAREDLGECIWSALKDIGGYSSICNADQASLKEIKTNFFERMRDG